MTGKYFDLQGINSADIVPLKVTCYFEPLNVEDKVGHYFSLLANLSRV